MSIFASWLLLLDYTNSIIVGRIATIVDKTEGDVVTFTTRRGDEISGTCLTMKEILITVPDDHKNREKPES